MLGLLLGEEQALPFQAGLAALRRCVVLLLFLGVELRRALAHALDALGDSVHFLPHLEKLLSVDGHVSQSLRSKCNL